MKIQEIHKKPMEFLQQSYEIHKIDSKQRFPRAATLIGVHENASYKVFNCKLTRKSAKNSHRGAQKGLLVEIQQNPRVKKNGEYWRKWQNGVESQKMTFSRWQKVP